MLRAANALKFQTEIQPFHMSGPNFLSYVLERKRLSSFELHLVSPFGFCLYPGGLILNSLCSVRIIL